MALPSTESSRVRAAAGPRAVEALLEADLRAEVARRRADPGLLSCPLVIVVPSASLRAHVATRLVAWAGGACAGIEVVTLSGAARAVLAAARVPPPQGGLLFEHLVARALAHDPHLARGLAPFVDAAAVLGGTLRDVFDAGFEPAHAASLDELLVDPATPATAEERATARAVVRAAVHVFEQAAALGLALGSEAPRRAARVLREEPGLWPTHGVWIHGFADATGAALDLLEVLLARTGGRVYHDSLAQSAFGAPLRARLAIARPSESTPEPPRIELGRAPNHEREARAAVERVRAAIAAGTPPERIAIVARDLVPYRVALRRHLTRLAVPFSGLGLAGSDGPAERRVRALAHLLETGADCRLERWLDARDREASHSSVERVLQDVGLRALGVARLGAFAELDLALRLDGRDALRLPVRAVSARLESGLDAAFESDAGELEEADPVEDEPDEGGLADSASEAQRFDARARTAAGRRTRFERREVSRAALEAERALATLTLAALERAAETAPTGTANAPSIPARVADSRRFVRDVLGWRETTAGYALLEDALDEITIDLPHDLALDSRTFHALLAARLVHHAAPPFGGAGGGVAILGVTEARGRTFDRLEVLGLARGRFPRTVREDPLLPDALRAALAALLPDLAQKGVGRDEERVLFDALVRAAAVVHLSWPALDDAEKPVLPSALLERVATPAEIAAAPLAADPEARAGSLPRPAHEHAAWAARAGGHAGLAPLLTHALAEARAANGLDPSHAEDIAAARLAVLAEHEPDFAARARLGPYFGWVGPADSGEDLRQGELWVTELETLARCGWQAFLRHLLKLEPPLDPVGTLPDVDARILGDVVHRVLKRVYDGRGARGGWPDATSLVEWTRAAARHEAAERGHVLLGFDLLVASRALPLIEVARALDATEKGVTVEGSEVGGEIELPAGFQGPRALRFRADRVDRTSSGPRYTDYKTGSPIDLGKRDETRRKHHLTGVANGSRLQAIVYAIAAGDGGLGRYVFLKEGLPEHAREFALTHGDAAAVRHFEATCETLLAAWDLGAFTPRLLAANLSDSNRGCLRCEVKTACLRGDSTAHRRLAAFVSACDEDPEPALAAARELWGLSERAAETPEAPRAHEPGGKPRRKKP